MYVVTSSRLSRLPFFFFFLLPSVIRQKNSDRVPTPNCCATTKADFFFVSDKFCLSRGTGELDANDFSKLSSTITMEIESASIKATSCSAWWCMHLMYIVHI